MKRIKREAYVLYDKNINSIVAFNPDGKTGVVSVPDSYDYTIKIYPTLKGAKKAASILNAKENINLEVLESIITCDIKV